MTDRTFAEAGTVVMACSVCAIGIVHLFLPGLRPILAPIPPDEIPMLVGPIIGVILFGAGLFLAIRQTRFAASVFLACVFLLFFLFGHLPNRIRYNPEILAYWTDALKMLTMTGGMMLIARRSKEWNPRIARWLSRGKYFFAFMLVVFGIDHFLYVDFVHKMVPSFFGFPKAWTYLTGVALIAAGLAIFVNILYKPATRLLALMLLSWFFMVHLPDTIDNPIGDGGILIGLITCAFFLGIALILGWDERTKYEQPGRDIE